MKRLIALTVVVVWAATACSSTPKIEASDPIFAGLDAKVVQEVLANPKAQSTASSNDPETTKMFWQGMTVNFILCRQAYAAYEQWTKTGTAPSLPPLTRPTNPNANAMQGNDVEREMFVKALSSGDIDALRNSIVNPEGGCGSWIPAKPGDNAGPTIADAIKGS